MAKQKYEWDADDYAGHSASQHLWAQELMAKLALQGHEAVLDIGCGDGKVTAEIARHVAQGSVLGLDSSAAMIAFAQSHFTPASYPTLRFVHGDARQLDFEAAFDIVFSNAALHWILDHRPVLRGIARSLRPGGRVLLQMGGAGNAAGLISAFDAVIQTRPWSRYFASFSFPYGFHAPDAYRQWLAAAGLHPRRVELIPKDMVHQGREGLAGWIRSAWLPYTAPVPLPDRPAFITDVVETYINDHPLDDAGQAHVGMVRLEVDAVR